jgi:hypothetical protein
MEWKRVSDSDIPERVVLLGYSSNWIDPDFNPDETPRATAVREFYEETGCRLDSFCVVVQYFKIKKG